MNGDGTTSPSSLYVGSTKARRASKEAKRLVDENTCTVASRALHYLLARGH